MQRFGAHRTATFLTIAVAAALLSGCATESPKTVDTSTPDAAAPLFASDEEALAAAEAAYAKYQAAFDVVSASGGVDIAGLAEVADKQALERANQSAQDLVKASVRGGGSTDFETYKVQSLAYSAADATELKLYVCDDVSKAELWSASGESLVLPDRVVRVPFEISVGYVEGKGLVLVEKNFWTGDTYCSL